MMNDENPKAKDIFEGGLCPDCGQEIDDEAVHGDECSNCGHVFVWGEDDDEWARMEPLFPNGV